MSDSLNKSVDFLVTPQAGIVQSGMLDPNKVKQLVLTSLMFVCKHAQHKVSRWLLHGVSALDCSYAYV